MSRAVSIGFCRYHVVTGEALEVAGMFDPLTLGISFSEKYAPATEVTGDPFGWLHRNVPDALINHELAHAVSMMTTPAGLKDFLMNFMAEDLSKTAISQASISLRPPLPIGLAGRLKDLESVPEVLEKMTHVVKFSSFLETRMGGLEFHIDQESSVPDGLHFLADLDRKGGASKVLLGTRHLFEGFAQSVELGTIILAGERLTHAQVPPFDPYLVCSAIFDSLGRQRSTGSYRGTHLELAVVIDTALMMDSWIGGDTKIRYPYDDFWKLLNVLTKQGDLELARGGEGVEEFQNQLLEAVDNPLQKVSDIVKQEIEFLPELVREVRHYSSMSPSLAHTLLNSIKEFLTMRLDAYDGACPLGWLIGGARQQKEIMLRKLPSTASGSLIPPVLDGDVTKNMFSLQTVGHIKRAVDEIIYGRQRCYVYDLCKLPHRAACEGFTKEISAEGNRCPRETVLTTLNSEFDL